MECKVRKEDGKRPEVDELTLDVREADAEGLSYGKWRVRQMLAKQKAKQKPKKSEEK